MLINLTKKYTPFLAYTFSSEVKIKTSKKLAIRKKQQSQLQQVKRHFANKQPVKSQDIYKDYHYKEIYKKIDISIESFFFKRQYNVENFNFLINLIGEQKPDDYQERIEDVLKKMAIIGIQQNQKTYNYMIKAAGMSSNVELAQNYFEKAVKEFLPNKYLYTSLVQVYVRNNDPNMGMKIVNEMQQKGIQPDISTYTTLINCFRLGRNLQKCWEINRKITKMDIQLDEAYVGVMMKVYAASHDAEKSIKLYRQNIKQKGIKPMIETTNAYFKALSSRRQYVGIVIDSFFYMFENGNIINSQTATWALRACSKTGSIRSAVQIMKIMKVKNLQMTKQTFNCLLRVYSKACSIPGIQQQHRQVILADSWKLLDELKKKNEIDTTIVNNMLSAYVKSNNVQEIDGLVLPLYEKFNLPYNMYTFENLLQMYYSMSEFNQFMRIWAHQNEKIKDNEKAIEQRYGEHGEKHVKMQTLSQNLRPTFRSTHLYLQVGIKLLKMDLVLDGLEMFKKLKRPPNNDTLKFLGNLQNLPEQIRVSLMDFKIQFGAAKVSKKQLPLVKDPQNI